jgi:hypothetical protein
MVRLALAALAMVALAACGGDSKPEPSSSDDGSSARTGAAVGQHWHAAFGLQICGKLADPLRDAAPDQSGLHSHGEGLIHIHPFAPQFAGPNASLATFLNTEGITLEGSKVIHLPGGGELDTAEGCDGKPATIRLIVDNKRIDGDPGAYLPQDGQVIHLIFDDPAAPVIPLPWADSVDHPSDVR